LNCSRGYDRVVQKAGDEKCKALTAKQTGADGCGEASGLVVQRKEDSVDGRDAGTQQKIENV